MLSDYLRSTVTVPGVWFLDEESLRGLDALLGEQLKKLKRKQKNDIAREIRRKEKHLRELYPNGGETFELKLEAAKRSAKESHRGESIQIVISDDRQQLMKCATFAEAIENQVLAKEIPTQFEVVIAAGENKVDVSLDHSSITGDEIRVKVPPDDPHCTSVSDSIHHWAKSCRQPPTLCLWNKYNVLMTSFSFIGGWLLSVFFLQTRTLTPDTDNLRNAAKEILKLGVNDNNRNEAISLLLQISLGETPRREMVFNPWLALFVVMSVVVSIYVIANPPHSVLGIGKGKNVMASRISWFAFWTKRLPYLVLGAPSAVILEAVLGNWAYEQIRGMFSQ